MGYEEKYVINGKDGKEGKEGKDDDDEVEVEDDFDIEDEESGFGVLNIISIIFVSIVILTLVILIFYRDSRPEELKSVFEPFDNYLSGPQNNLNEFIKNFKKFIENKEGKEKQRAEEKKKKWENQQIEIDLIKLKLENDNNNNNALKDKNFEEEEKFWKFQIENIEKEIKRLKDEHEEQIGMFEEVELTLKSTLLDHLGSMEGINKLLTSEIKKIKETNFNLNYDEIIKEIYTLTFKTSIMNTFINDLDTRREDIVKVLRSGSGNGLYEEKYFYNWLWKQRKDENFIKGIKLKSIQDLESKVKKINNDNNDNNNNKDKNIKIEIDKAVKGENSALIEKILKASQEFEGEIFILLSKDINFYGKVVDLVNVKTNSIDFINEFKVLKLKGEHVQFEHFNILFKRLENKIKKQQEPIKNINNNNILLECWHKRNLLNLFTDKKLIFYDQWKFDEIKNVYEYSEKFNVWLKEKLLGLPHEEPIGVKKKYEQLIKAKDSKPADVVLVNFPEPELETIVTRKLAIFDHSPYEFVLDRIIKDYNKFALIKKSTEMDVMKHFSFTYYTEGYLLMATAYYGHLMRHDPKALASFRNDWPKAGSNDTSLLADEGEYKNLLVRSVNGNKNLLPASYRDLIIVDAPPRPPPPPPKKKEEPKLNLTIKMFNPAHATTLVINHLINNR